MQAATTESRSESNSHYDSSCHTMGGCIPSSYSKSASRLAISQTFLLHSSLESDAIVLAKAAQNCKSCVFWLQRCTFKKLAAGSGRRSSRQTGQLRNQLTRISGNFAHSRAQRRNLKAPASTVDCFRVHAHWCLFVR